jgi:hypothetical protein
LRKTHSLFVIFVLKSATMLRRESPPRIGQVGRKTKNTPFAGVPSFLTSVE